MTKFIGRRIKVGIGKEAVRGVGVVPSYWLNCLSFGFDDKVNRIKSEGGYGGIWGGDKAFTTNKYAEGDVEAEMGDKSFGLILLAALGEVSSAVFSGANKHTYSLQNDNQHDSLSITTEDPIGDLIFELSMINSLVIDITPEDLVKYTVNFMSKASQSSSIAATYSAENKFLGRHLTFKVGNTTADLTAASKICLTKLTLTIEKNAEFHNCLGSIQPADIINKMFSIKGELELAYEDRTWKDYMINATNKAIRIDLVNTDVTIGTTNPSFRIDLSKVYFEEWDKDAPNDDMATQKINFEGMYDLGGNGNVINDCYVINEDATY